SLERLGRALQDRLEARLYLLAAVATEQLRDALRPHSAGGHFGVQVAAQAVGQARVADHHPDQVLVRDAAAVELHRRDDQPFLVIRGTMAGHGAGDAAADVIVVPERLDERYHLALVVDRHGNAQVRQVPDPTLRLVDVVVEEDVARLDRVNRKVTDDRLHERRVGAAGQLTAMAVVDSAAEVARLADHRGARGPLDRRLNLRLGRSQRASTIWSTIGSTDTVMSQPHPGAGGAPGAPRCRLCPFAPSARRRWPGTAARRGWGSTTPHNLTPRRPFGLAAGCRSGLL